MSSQLKTKEEIDSETQEFMIHIYFGRLGHLSDHKTTQYSWNRGLPFNHPMRSAWAIQLSEEKLLRLLHGFTPLSMDDKWFIYATGPDVAGSAQIHFHHSWSGRKIAELEIETSWGQSSDLVSNTGRVSHVTIEGEQADMSSEQDSAMRIESNEIVGPPQTDSAAQSGDDLQGEEFVKFLVLIACRRVLNVSLLDTIEKPQAWINLCSQPLRTTSGKSTEELAVEPPKEVYRSANHSRETGEDIKRAGGMEQYFALAPAGAYITFK